MICHIKNLKFKFKCGIFYNKHSKSIKNRWSIIDGVVMGVHSSWDYFSLNVVVKFLLRKYPLYDFLLRYGGEVFLEIRSIFSMINISLL